ncbi:MAG: hypothetical protein BWY60_00082 [Actinobacteria bacterium ADurb.Bin346]|nr:MAG: hypothetical protein BWY60_00082 [Actinobacteria bacterium ADurb.Bin346]
MPVVSPVLAPLVLPPVSTLIMPSENFLIALDMAMAHFSLKSPDLKRSFSVWFDIKAHSTNAAGIVVYLITLKSAVLTPLFALPVWLTRFDCRRFASWFEPATPLAHQYVSVPCAYGETAALLCIETNMSAPLLFAIFTMSSRLAFVSPVRLMTTSNPLASSLARVRRAMSRFAVFS